MIIFMRVRDVFVPSDITYTCPGDVSDGVAIKMCYMIRFHKPGIRPGCGKTAQCSGALR